MEVKLLGVVVVVFGMATSFLQPWVGLCLVVVGLGHEIAHSLLTDRDSSRSKSTSEVGEHLHQELKADLKKLGDRVSTLSLAVGLKTLGQ